MCIIFIVGTFLNVIPLLIFMIHVCVSGQNDSVWCPGEAESGCQQHYIGVNLTCIHLTMLHVQEYIIFSVNETSTEASIYAYICSISLIMHIRGCRGYTQSATEFEGVDWWF